jgi:hypothetical protein
MTISKSRSIFRFGYSANKSACPLTPPMRTTALGFPNDAQWPIVDANVIRHITLLL